MASTKMAYHKLVILGGGGAGKTAMVLQLVFGKFVDEYDPTIEDSYRRKAEVDGEVCMIEILDTAGQEEYSAMREAYMKTGEAFILVYSVSSRYTFKQAQAFYQQIMRVKAANQGTHGPALQAPIIWLVGNKADMTGGREIAPYEGIALARELECTFTETTARSRDQVLRSTYPVRNDSF